MDRVTQILYGTTAACVPSSGNCIEYTYDTDGNLTQRVDNTGTTTYTYDDLNRLIDKGTPGGSRRLLGFLARRHHLHLRRSVQPVHQLCDVLGHHALLLRRRQPPDVRGRAWGYLWLCRVPPPTTDTGCTAFSYDNDNHLKVTQFPGGATQTSTWNAKRHDGFDSRGQLVLGTTETSFVYTCCCPAPRTRPGPDPSGERPSVSWPPLSPMATTPSNRVDLSGDDRRLLRPLWTITTTPRGIDAPLPRPGTPALCPTGTNYSPTTQMMN